MTSLLPYIVVRDRRSEWASKVEFWRREETRSQIMRQSADTVAGRRAEYDASPPTTDEIVEAFHFKYGIK